MVGAGAVVTKNIPDFALVIGNPAKFKHWVDKSGNKLEFNSDNIAVDEKGSKYHLNKNSDNAHFVTEG